MRLSGLRGFATGLFPHRKLAKHTRFRSLAASPLPAVKCTRTMQLWTGRKRFQISFIESVFTTGLRTTTRQTKNCHNYSSSTGKVSANPSKRIRFCPKSSNSRDSSTGSEKRRTSLNGSPSSSTSSFARKSILGSLLGVETTSKIHLQEVLWLTQYLLRTTSNFI